MTRLSTILNILSVFSFFIGVAVLGVGAIYMFTDNGFLFGSLLAVTGFTLLTLSALAALKALRGETMGIDRKHLAPFILSTVLMTLGVVHVAIGYINHTLETMVPAVVFFVLGWIVALIDIVETLNENRWW